MMLPHPCVLGLGPWRHRVAVVTLAAATTVASNAHAAQIDQVQVVRQQGHRSAVDGLVEGIVAAPYGAVVATLCDYDAYSTFSETTKRQAVVTQAQADELKARLAAADDAVQDNDDVAGYVQEGIHKPNCPNGSDYVMALQEFPWPVGDAWIISRYNVQETSAGFRIEYKTYTGTGFADGVWVVKPRPDGKTWVKNDYIFDPGISLPEFLVRMGSKRQLPDLFNLLEKQAQTRAMADPVAAARLPTTAPANPTSAPTP